MSEKEVEVIIDSDENFRRILVAGIVGGTRPSGLEATIFSERQVTDDIVKVMNTGKEATLEKIVIKRTIECELIIDPLQMVSIYNWLGDKIAEYQRIFGPHPLIHKVEEAYKKNIDLSMKDSNSTQS
jgi:hypothetical protein